MANLQVYRRQGPGPQDHHCADGHKPQVRAPVRKPRRHEHRCADRFLVTDKQDLYVLRFRLCALSDARAGSINLLEPGHDDFELWSPAEEREEQCLFGRRTLYHRRKREIECAVGTQPKLGANIVENCECKDSDFECEYNHYRNSDGQCVLMDGEKPLADDDSCRDGADFWYERTAYRKIAHSSCEGGPRPDRGAEHACPGFGSHGAAFWWTLFALPFIFTGAVAWWWHRTRGFGGAIRLPGGGQDPRYRGSTDSGILATVASIPWFVVGIAGVGWEWVTSRMRDMSGGRRRGGYRNISVDEDAQVLRFQDEE